MALIPLSEQTNESKAWIFGIPAPLDAEAREKAVREMVDFAAGWRSKGKEVRASVELRDERFLIVAAEEWVMSSGCAMDRVFKQVRSISGELGVDLLDANTVFWREGDRVRSASRSEFRRLAERGEVGPDTLVYDITVDSVAALRNGEWLRPAARSWHAAAFPLARVS